MYYCYRQKFIASSFSCEVQDNRAAALALYSKERALDAQAMVVESHKADQGFWQFIFPIIMDSIFNKLMPGLFRPSMFKSMNQGGEAYPGKVL